MEVTLKELESDFAAFLVKWGEFECQDDCDTCFFSRRVRIPREVIRKPLCQLLMSVLDRIE